MRVIAGAYKGRRLASPSWPGLRPTSDKLRETLFNILAPLIRGARVFDGFAGTGAIGIEALSRGAASVTFVESDRRAISLIVANVAECGVPSGYTIRCADVRTVLADSTDDQFDLVLLDPPYGAAGIRDVLIAAGARLSAEGLVVLERASRYAPDVPASLMVVRDVRSGDSTLTFLRGRHAHTDASS
jgi:16S rRNA (guanine966-N2)-methyltransferase